MRISDWSSDVCSSDLLVAFLLVVGDRLAEAVEGLHRVELVVGLGGAVVVLLDLAVLDHRLGGAYAEVEAALAVGAAVSDVIADADREKILASGLVRLAGHVRGSVVTGHGRYSMLDLVARATHK